MLGGLVDAGEDAMATAAREAEEEHVLSFPCSVPTVTAATSVRYHPVLAAIWNPAGPAHVVSHCAQVRIWLRSSGGAQHVCCKTPDPGGGHSRLSLCPSAR
ncbi:MAG: NUDIX domain-containing protein [Pseudonocardiaceae bacterium]